MAEKLHCSKNTAYGIFMICFDTLFCFDIPHFFHDLPSITIHFTALRY